MALTYMQLLARQEHFIYHHVDALGEILYVGITTNLKSRTNTHLRSSGWGARIARVLYFGPLARPQALDVEASMIDYYRPVFNKLGITVGQSKSDNAYRFYSRESIRGMVGVPYSLGGVARRAEPQPESLFDAPVAPAEAATDACEAVVSWSGSVEDALFRDFASDCFGLDLVTHDGQVLGSSA